MAHGIHYHLTFSICAHCLSCHKLSWHVPRRMSYWFTGILITASVPIVNLCGFYVFPVIPVSLEFPSWPPLLYTIILAQCVLRSGYSQVDTHYRSFSFVFDISISNLRCSLHDRWISASMISSTHIAKSFSWDFRRSVWRLQIMSWCIHLKHSMFRFSFVNFVFLYCAQVGLANNTADLLMVLGSCTECAISHKHSLTTIDAQFYVLEFGAP